MATVVITLVTLILCFCAAHYFAGWLLAFLVVAQVPLIKYAVLVMFGAIALAVTAGNSNRSNRWWAVMFIAILFCVGLEQLEPHVEVIRIVLAAFFSIWATYTLHRPVIRPLAQMFHRQQRNP